VPSHKETTDYQNLPEFKKFPSRPITATVSSDTDNNNDFRVLTFQSPQPDLAVGMQVSGGNIQFLTTIIKIVKISEITYYYMI
jgi:hypothetical protein